MQGPLCAEASVAVGEGVLGSAAAGTEVWLILEYGRTWAPKPLGPSELPDAVKQQIGRWLDQVPGSRLQLTRQPGRSRDAAPRLFVARSCERDPWCVEIPIADYDALLALDLPAVVEGGEAPGARRVEQPLHLVCTHGKRDNCCARWGMPVYRALAERNPDGVWQTTHLGGHRFAANVVLLPHGISYGRVRPEDAGPMLEAHARGDMFELDALRGRTCYAAPVQAAEYFVRRDTGFRALEGLHHRTTETLGEDRWRIRFALPGNREHQVTVERETRPARPSSCGDAPEPATRFCRV